MRNNQSRQRAICSQLLLREESRWKATTSTTLPTPKQIHEEKRKRVPTNLSSNQQTGGMHSVYKVRHKMGYNNIRIKEGDEWKAAFLMPQGLFEPLVMFFGLTNSPATFQEMMNKIFRMEVAQGWLSVYMDDIAIHTKPSNRELEQQHELWHKQLIHQVLEKLEMHDLYLKPEKCEFLKREIEYLGVIIENGVLKMNPKKLEASKTGQCPITQQKYESS